MWYGYYGDTGHLLKNVNTNWEYRFGQIGLMTYCTIYTSKLPIETHKIYFQGINGEIFASDLLIYSQFAGYRCKHSKEYDGDAENCWCPQSEDWAAGLPKNNIVTDIELDFIRDNVEGVGYILDKCIKNGIKGNLDLYKVLRVWMQHKDMEYVVAAGQWQLGLNKSFWKLSESKKKQVINWIRANGKSKYQYTLGYILDDIKGMDHLLRAVAQNHKFPYGVTPEYFNEQMEQCGFNPENKMRDYYRMCRELKKDLTDKYWLMPKDLFKAHDKVMKEIEALEEARKKEQIKTMNEQICKRYKKYRKFNFSEGKYTISIPKTEEEIMHQAKILSQCLITAKYDKKFANGEIILVFIKKDEVPIATMEVVGKKIKQFYADEGNKENCRPSPKIRALGEQWLENYKAA